MAFIEPLIIKDQNLQNNRLQKENQTMSENLWKVLYIFMIKTGKLKKERKEKNTTYQHQQPQTAAQLMNLDWTDCTLASCQKVHRSPLTGMKK